MILYAKNFVFQNQRQWCVDPFIRTVHPDSSRRKWLSVMFRIHLIIVNDLRFWWRFCSCRLRVEVLCIADVAKGRAIFIFTVEVIRVSRRLYRQGVPCWDMSRGPVQLHMKKSFLTATASVKNHQHMVFLSGQWPGQGPRCCAFSLGPRIRLHVTCGLNPTHYQPDDGGSVFLWNIDIRAQSRPCGWRTSVISLMGNRNIMRHSSLYVIRYSRSTSQLSWVR